MRAIIISILRYSTYSVSHPRSYSLAIYAPPPPRRETHAGMDEFKKILRSLLLSAKDGLTLRAIELDYRETNFENVPYRELGFANTRSLVSACSDVARLSGETYFGIADASTEHIAKMVSLQKPKKSRGKGQGGGGFNKAPPQPRFKGSSLANRYRSGGHHQYNVHRPAVQPAVRPIAYYQPSLAFVQQRQFNFLSPSRPNQPAPFNYGFNKPAQPPFNFRHMTPPLLPTSRMPPSYGKESVALPVSVLKKQLNDLLAGNKKGTNENAILVEYERRYGKPLNLSANRFSSVKTMVDVVLRHGVGVASPAYSAPNRIIYANYSHLQLNELVPHMVYEYVCAKYS